MSPPASRCGSAAKGSANAPQARQADRMIGYATVGTNDIDRARGFYDDLLGQIGARRVMEFPQNGFTMYGTGARAPGLAVTRPYDGAAATAGNGNMAAIVVDSRDKVDRLHGRAIELGGADEGGPGLRG